MEFGRTRPGFVKSATAEKDYTVRPLDLLRVHHEKIEAWILEQGGVTFHAKAAPGALLVALRQVAKAHGMAEVARRANVGEKTLFRSLSENGNPTLSTVHKVLHTMGASLERYA